MLFKAFRSHTDGTFRGCKSGLRLCWLPVLARTTWPYAWLLPCKNSAPQLQHEPRAMNDKSSLPPRHPCIVNRLQTCWTLCGIVPLGRYSLAGVNSCSRTSRASGGGSPRVKEEREKVFRATACSLSALGKTHFCSSSRADASSRRLNRCEWCPDQAKDRCVRQLIQRQMVITWVKTTRAPWGHHPPSRHNSTSHRTTLFFPPKTIRTEDAGRATLMFPLPPIQFRFGELYLS